jgi:hypothetical protein
MMENGSLISEKLKFLDEFLSALNLKQNQDVFAVLLAGSHARGTSDELSDVELLIWVNSLEEFSSMDFSLRHQVLALPEVIPFVLHEKVSENTHQVNDSVWFGQNQRMDLMYADSFRLHEIAQTISTASRVDPSYQSIICSLNDSTFLHRSIHCPEFPFPIGFTEEIAKCTLVYGVAQIKLQMLEISQQRQDFILVRHILLNFCRGYLTCLFALNKRFMPGYKHLKKTVAQLAQKPPRVVERLDAIMSTHLKDDTLKTTIQVLWDELKELDEEKHWLEILPNKLEFKSSRPPPPNLKPTLTIF